MLLERTRTILMVFILGLLAACGSDNEPPVSDPGVLSITVLNLPPGLPALIHLTGPDGDTRTVTQSTVLANLEPGRYTIAPDTIVDGARIWQPQRPEQSVSVAPNASAAVSVSYSPLAFSLGLREVADLPGAVFLTAPPGDPRLFIVERSGRIFIARDGLVQAQPFLDIRARVSTEGEGGLLSMAFDPQYAFNGFFYLYYTNLDKQIVIERRRVSTLPDLADALAALTIVRIDHPVYQNHFGGQVSFGPDGLMYLATGDGGGAGDPMDNAQDRLSLLGKMLRIDVSGASAAQPYTIPVSNPFRERPDGLPEIWALGLRNPWRFAFDASLLYIADVGQARREEVNIEPIDEPALNYGWDIMEGSLCFESASCDQSGLTLPAFEYQTGTDATCAITGGLVYRGRAIPELQGRYFYSDHCAGFLRSFVHTEAGVVEQTDWPIPDIGNVYSFGADASGELYLLSASGKVYQIVRN